MYGIYAITPTFDQLPSDQWLLRACRELLGNGVGTLQLRDKSADQARRLKVASQLMSLCQDHNARLIINDDPDLARAVDAHGVHLGQQDGQIAQARAQLGDQAIVGRTCHNSLTLAAQAEAEGASYLAFGRFFSSHTKPQAQAASLQQLTRARAQFRCPLVAIGGVNLDNAPQLINAGAHALALCHALFSAGDIAQSARDFCHLFEQGPAHEP